MFFSQAYFSKINFHSVGTVKSTDVMRVQYIGGDAQYIGDYHDCSEVHWRIFNRVHCYNIVVCYFGVQTTKESVRPTKTIPQFTNTVETIPCECSCEHYPQEK